MELSQRLAALKAQNNLTTEKLAQLSGVPRGTINKLLNGETRNPTARTLRQLALALGCAPGELYLSAEKSVSERKTDQPPPDAGEAFSYDFTVRAADDSMADRRIRKGDLVFCRRCDAVSEGGIAALTLDGALTLARVYHLESGLLLERGGEPPLLLHAENQSRVSVLGQAVAFRSIL